MSRSFSRQEPTPRYGVTPHCRGRAVQVRSGVTCEFRGVDVSHHGFGCVIVGDVRINDAILLEIGGQKLTFEVMWVESHLGIENTYRVGLQCLDRLLDVRGRLSHLGFVTVPLDDGFAA
jgi:hypothetical protein